MDESSPEHIGIILLAAGSSARLGEPKQLLRLEEHTLLEHSLQVAQNSAATSVVVVLGAYAEAIQKSLDSSAASVVINADWPEGMASSIRCGLKALLEINPAVRAVILMACDQPFIRPAVLNDLMETYRNSYCPIVTCRYTAAFGPPTLFDRSIFPELLALQGDTGARRILSQHADAVKAIPFPEGDFDIDTQADYQKYFSRYH